MQNFSAVCEKPQGGADTRPPPPVGARVKASLDLNRHHFIIRDVFPGLPEPGTPADRSFSRTFEMWAHSGTSTNRGGNILRVTSTV